MYADSKAPHKMLKQLSFNILHATFYQVNVFLIKMISDFNYGELLAAL
jgi:hypothetical protein